MKKTLRHYVSPVIALAAFAIGVGCVRATELITAMFTDPVAAVRAQPAENVGVTSTVNFKSFEPGNADPAVKGRVLSCYDPNILPIWQELKNDDAFKERLDHITGVMNCSDMMETEKVDLNGDKNKETLVLGKGHFCSPVGNCGFWIFQESDKSRPAMLLAASDYIDISELGDQVMRSRTRGYSDILLKGHFSAAETAYYTYKFDGQKYIESRCMYEVPKVSRDGEGSWELITCQEFDRRNQPF